MLPVPFLAFALRHDIVPFAHVLDLARTTPPWEAAQLGWGLASSLDDTQLDALDAALAARGSRSVPIQRELVCRKRFDAALGTPPQIPFDLFERALPSLTPSDRARWTEAATSKLEALVADPNATTRDRLAGAKVALRYRPQDTHADTLAVLDAGYAADMESGAYEQLDLVYGDIDPTLELARTHASVGSLTRARELLDARESRAALFYNAEEAGDAARIVAEVAHDQRDAFEARFVRWIEATPRGDEHEDAIAVRWWTDLAQHAGRDVDDRLLAIVRRARMSEALAEMDFVPSVGESVRNAIESKLVELTAGYVATLREVTSTGKVTDWQRHATSVRQLRSGITALTRDRRTLSDLNASRFREIARDWSRWIATQDISFDSLPYVYTAIAFAHRLRTDIPEAVESVARLSRGSAPLVVEYEGWEPLFTPERALELARSVRIP